MADTLPLRAMMNVVDLFEVHVYMIAQLGLVRGNVGGMCQVQCHFNIMLIDRYNYMKVSFWPHLYIIVILQFLVYFFFFLSTVCADSWSRLVAFSPSGAVC